MIEPFPTITQNITMATTMVPGAIYTSWSNINEVITVFFLLGVFLGWGIGYHCYRLGLRFPWHREVVHQYKRR